MDVFPPPPGQGPPSQPQHPPAGSAWPQQQQPHQQQQPAGPAWPPPQQPPWPQPHERPYAAGGGSAAAPGAPAAADQGSWWMRAVFNLALLEIGMVACALTFGLLDTNDLGNAFGIWFFTNIFVLPTAVIYGGLVEGLGRVLPTPVRRRVLAVVLSPLGGAMGVVFGLSSIGGDGDHALIYPFVFLVPVFLLGALWRVPGQRLRPVALYAIAGGFALSLVILGVATALAPDEGYGGFYCC